MRVELSGTVEPYWYMPSNTRTGRSTIESMFTLSDTRDPGEALENGMRLLALFRLTSLVVGQ